MDKNTIIGFVLIAAILIGWSWYNSPSEEELKAQQEQVEKEKAAAKLHQLIQLLFIGCKREDHRNAACIRDAVQVTRKHPEALFFIVP